jgi:hypothetical protein
MSFIVKVVMPFLATDAFFKYAKGSELAKRFSSRSHKSYCCSEVYLVFGILMLHSWNMTTTTLQGCGY